MHRFIYRAHSMQPEKASHYFHSEQSNLKRMISDGILMTLSIFCCDDDLFLYFESKDVLDPHQLLNGANKFLNPNRREKTCVYWLPMADIFHYSSPVDWEHWKRTSQVLNRPACIARLKPDWIASYVFYHYQLQEENPGFYDKYGIIGLHENLLFQYLEEPVVYDTTSVKGKLDTQNSPENWQEMMALHFLPWQDTSNEQKLWRPVNSLLVL